MEALAQQKKDVAKGFDYTGICVVTTDLTHDCGLVCTLCDAGKGGDPGALEKTLVHFAPGVLLHNIRTHCETAVHKEHVRCLGALEKIANPLPPPAKPTSARPPTATKGPFYSSHFPYSSHSSRFSRFLRL